MSANPFENASKGLLLSQFLQQRFGVALRLSYSDVAAMETLLNIASREPRKPRSDKGTKRVKTEAVREEGEKK